MSTDRTGVDDAMKRSFGFREIGEGEKQHQVNDVFHKVAERYDIMNDLMSAGMHRIWKDAMVTTLAPSKTRSWKSLDVAGGTGDVAFRIVDKSRGNAEVTVLDINGSMLGVGKERAQMRGLADNVEFVEANAEELPFEDSTFDAYTIAFGIRNVPDIQKALGEAHRVLRRGGRFLCLEFSEVNIPGLEQFYDAWSFNVIPRVGQMVTGDGDPYQYLVESIRKFPRQTDFAKMIEKAGFERVTWRDYTGGIAALHSGWKL